MTISTDTNRAEQARPTPASTGRRVNGKIPTFPGAVRASRRPTEPTVAKTTGAERTIMRRLAAYWTPPEVWVDPPSSLNELLDYARYGEWTEMDGPIRAFGICWSWVAVGFSTLLYYAAWIGQRPGRFFTVLFLYYLLAHSSIGSWLPQPWPSWM